MKLFRLSLFTITLLTVFSCGNKENDKTSEAVKEGMEILKDLPEIQKEIKSQEEKKNSHNLSGEFSGTLNGSAFNFTDWVAASSRGSFFDGKATFQFYINEELNEYLNITISGASIFNNEEVSNLAPTMIPFDMADESFMKKFENGFAYVQYKNETNNEEWSSAKGLVVLKKISNNELLLEWNGEAFLGEWKQKELAPFKGKLSLTFDFLTDYRNQ